MKPRVGRPGEAWEFQCEVWHKGYALRMQADLYKCEPGVKMVDGRLIYAEKGPPDFAGTLKGGRAVMFDCKEVTSGVLLPFANIKQHQASRLLRVNALGGIGFIAANFVKMKRRCIFPWTIDVHTRYVDWVGGAKAASLHADEFSVPMPTDGWLSWAILQGRI